MDWLFALQQAVYRVAVYQCRIRKIDWVGRVNLLYLVGDDGHFPPADVMEVIVRCLVRIGIEIPDKTDCLPYESRKDQEQEKEQVVGVYQGAVVDDRVCQNGEVDGNRDDVDIADPLAVADKIEPVSDLCFERNPCFSHPDGILCRKINNKNPRFVRNAHLFFCSGDKKNRSRKTAVLFCISLFRRGISRS